MKIIDLLNKIANGEDTPNAIKFDGKIFTHNGTSLNDNYYCAETNEILEENFVFSELNNEVQIIEDTPKEDSPEDKKIEDKTRFQYSQIPLWSDIIDFIRITNDNFEKHQKALNEIIDKLNGE